MKNILSLFIVFVLVSCGTSKTKDLAQKPTQNPDIVENIEPCTGKDYATNDEFLRSTINYKHINATEGKRLAREFAVEALASQIETIVSSVSDIVPIWLYFIKTELAISSLIPFLRTSGFVTKRSSPTS